MNWGATKPEDCFHTSGKIDIPEATFCPDCGQVWVDGKPDGDIIKWVRKPPREPVKGF